jgi:hypothetical protein
MPSSTHSISNFPFLFAVANCDYLPDDFMSWNSREDMFTQMALLEKAIRVADAARKYLDQNLARLGCRDGHFFDSPRSADFLNHNGGAGRRDVGRRHVGAQPVN